MNIAGYRAEADRELHAILLYWMQNTPDLVHGGFIGRIDGQDQPHPEAPKGLVLNSRILWTFSAVWRCAAGGSDANPGSTSGSIGHSIYRPIADRAYDYLVHNFLDREYGGAFWSLDAAGQAPDPRKQIYGQAFALYGLSEYYRASGQKTALDEAIALFRLIEQHSFDSGFNQGAGSPRGGYFEAFARDWSPLEDVRLSGKDANDPKTMNTHLHILEAYTNLYHAWPDPLLLSRIIGLLDIFDRYIIGAIPGHVAAPGRSNPAAHLGLFFDTNWKSRSNLISYGHDIEAAWLLHEAALVINNNEWITKTSRLALRIAAAAAEGLDTDGGLWYEQEDGHLIRQKHWWPQAEAMVGFLQAWQLSGETIWWQRSLDSWNFVKEHIRSPDGKEWYWGVEADNSPMPGQDKAGFWKCPYHNSRACLEIIRRLQEPSA